MNVCFIAHGNAQTGMGHIMRSLSLADAFKEKNHNIIFFSKYPLGLYQIRKKGYKVVPMPYEEKQITDGNFFYGNLGELECDLKFLYNHLDKTTDVLVVDSYNVTEEFLNGLRKTTKCLVYIDDLNAFHYPVDIILNGSASALQMGYEKNQTARLLLGTEYVLLRKEFWHVPEKTFHPKIENVLVTTGNSDPFHVTERILHFALEDQFLRALHWHVIIGSGFLKDIWSDQLICENENITLYNSPQNMKDIMLSCDMAVTAGGSTIYELAACGIPMAVFIFAENQRAQVEELERADIILNVGNYNLLNGEKIKGYITELEEDFLAHKQLVDKLRTLVCRNASQKVASYVESFFYSKM